MEGMNTTLYFWRREKNQEALMCFCVFWERNMVRKERKNAQKCPNSSQKPTFWVLVQSRVSGAIYSTWHTFLGMTHLQGAPGWCHRDISKFVLLNFLVSTSDAHLEVFSDSDWGDLGVPGCLIFKTLKKLKFEQLDQKLWPREAC